MGGCLLAAGAPQPCAAPQALPGSPRGRRGGTPRPRRDGSALAGGAGEPFRPPPAACRSQREIKPRAGGNPTTRPPRPRRGRGGGGRLPPGALTRRGPLRDGPREAGGGTWPAAVAAGLWVRLGFRREERGEVA